MTDMTESLSSRGLFAKFRDGIRAVLATDFEPELARDPGGDQQVVLEVVGSKKIQVIKVIRDLTHISLVRAKALTDETPSILAGKMAPDVAARAVSLLAEAGATARVEPLPPHS